MASRKLALVTGASGGMGSEFADLLAADGYDLALVARSSDKLEKVAATLRARYSVDVRVIAMDLAVAGAAAALSRDVPACDVLINNAGFATNGRFDSIDPMRIAQEMELDIVTLTLLTRAYVPSMRVRRCGLILNVASSAAFLPGPFMAVYYASKAYVLSFSQAIAEELRGTGVGVTCFCPGATATGFADRAGLHGSLLFALPGANARTMAIAGYRGMRQGKDVVVPWPPTNRLVDVGARLMPRRWMLSLSRKAVEIERRDT